MQNKNNWLIKIGTSIFIFISLYTLSFLLNPYSDYWEGMKDCYDIDYILFEFVMTFIFSLGIMEGSIFIANRLEKHLPWTKFSILRFIIQVICIILFVIILFLIQHIIYKTVFSDEVLSPQENLDMQQFFVTTVIISLFVTTIHTAFFLLRKWEDSISEADKLKIKTLELKEIALQAELQSLKIQLDPHFMFNNFSTLSELINENPNVAGRFLENLSRVYRYMIQNLKKDMISLEEEMKFVQAYVFLIEIRHDENVKIQINVAESALNLFIPPIAIQLLIENAIKHNIATKERPLVISIETKNNTLIVTNNLQRIANPFPSTGIGLQNITDRYKILSNDGMPLIEENENEFKVILTLINLK